MSDQNDKIISGVPDKPAYYDNRGSCLNRIYPMTDYDIRGLNDMQFSHNDKPLGGYTDNVGHGDDSYGDITSYATVDFKDTDFVNCANWNKSQSYAADGYKMEFKDPYNKDDCPNVKHVNSRQCGAALEGFDLFANNDCIYNILLLCLLIILVVVIAKSY